MPQTYEMVCLRTQVRTTQEWTRFRAGFTNISGQDLRRARRLGLRIWEDSPWRGRPPKTKYVISREDFERMSSGRVAKPEGPETTSVSTPTWWDMLDEDFPS